MAKARAIVKRRKAVQNIRKITRTMELIATTRFRKALEPRDRGRGVHPQDRRAGRRPGRDVSKRRRIRCWSSASRCASRCLLVLTSNRGLAGGYNGNVLRAAMARYQDNQTEGIETIARGRRQARHRLFPVPQARAGRHLHPVRGPAAVRRGRGAGRQVHQAVRSGRDRPARRGLHPVRHGVAAGGDRPDAAADVDRRSRQGRARRSGSRMRLPRTASRRAARPSPSRTSSCPTPRASSRRSCRSRSRSGSSSASWTPPSASRSRGWSPWAGRPRTPTTSSSRSPGSTTAPGRSQITRELAEIVGGAAALE